MRIVTANEIQGWLSQGEILEKDSRGPKVIRLADGSFLKIFRSRHAPFLARLRPDALRFKANAETLQHLAISTPQVQECLWLDRDKAVSACLYQPLQGTPLDKLFHDARKDFDKLLPQLAGYIHTLHQRGIYFRSLHLGNILLTPEQGLGLIDFLDIRFKKGPLSERLTRRNFEHLRNYLKRRKVQDFPWDSLQQYYKASGGNQAG